MGQNTEFCQIRQYLIRITSKYTILSKNYTNLRALKRCSRGIPQIWNNLINMPKDEKWKCQSRMDCNNCTRQNNKWWYKITMLNFFQFRFIPTTMVVMMMIIIFTSGRTVHWSSEGDPSEGRNRKSSIAA